MTGSHRGKWIVLAVVGAAFFMTILDVAIVNVAIPSIQKDLHIAESTVQWVLTAYAITFGGFLLLGGRMADLLGRRLIFIVGLVLFTLASLACGLASSADVLIASRAVQGVGAAIISPAALSIVTTTFSEGAERNKALGIWGALGGSGAAAGVLFGGILTKYLGWEWIFFVNVPVGALVLALTRPIVPESHADLGHRRFDAAGAVSVTGGLALLVYAISKAPDVGWATGRTIGFMVAALAILALFVFWETRTTAPLVPFGIFRIRTLTGANTVGLLLGATIYANFFILTLYVQQVLGWSALKTGLTFLATAGTVVIWAGVAQALVTRVGPRSVMTVGLAVLALTVLGYTRLPVDGHYWPDLLPLYLVFALGLAFCVHPRHDRRLHRSPASSGWARIGLAEHEPADRRSDRRRRHLDDLRLACKGRALHSAGLHVRLPLGVRCTRRIRRRRCSGGVRLFPRRPRSGSRQRSRHSHHVRDDTTRSRTG